MLAARLSGGSELDPVAFAIEVATLIDKKQVLMRAERGLGANPITLYMFRHDKIRDYYTHFAFLGDDPTTRHAYARDDQFGGVYELLARALPAGQAEELNEYLHISAAESQDHRLSDRFVQHLRWRQLLDVTDPSWISALDPPEVARSLKDFARLDRDRAALDEKLSALRTVVDRARAMSRIVTATDTVVLLDRITESLVALGAVAQENDKPYARAIELPGHGRLEVWALASAGPPPASVLAALDSLIREIVRLPALLIINIDAAKQPTERDWSAVLDWAAGLRPTGIFSMSAPELYRRLRTAEESGDASLWRELGGAAPAPVAAS